MVWKSNSHKIRWSTWFDCRTKGPVARNNFSCNLQRNKCCVASCKKKFTCNTPFCKKRRRTALYFSQCCKTSCLRVTSPQQLATQCCQNGPILFVIVRVASREKSCKRAALQAATILVAVASGKNIW